jgi:hypothetical protein
MFANSKINGISSKFVTKLTRGKALVAAAVAATGLVMSAGTSFGLTNDITALTTSLTTGSSTTVNNVTGYGASYSPFLSTNTYTMHYLGEDEAITSVTAGSLGTYSVSGLGTATVRRGSSGANNDTVWYQGSGTGANHSTVTLDGPLVSGFNQAFNSNNLLMGADNVFSNMGNAVGNNTNVDRIDLVYNGSSGGLKAGAGTAFSVLDRGPSNDHDSFDIAAITGYNPVTGQPTSYGPVIKFTDGTWGETALQTTTQEDITRKNDSISGDTLHPSDSTAQAIGGVLIQTDSLVPTGTTIYGYSIFPPTLSYTGNGSGTQLADWTNSSHYIPADSTSTGGGLDPAATLGALYSQSVPEPATGALAALAIGGFMIRRPNRKQA